MLSQTNDRAVSVAFSERSATHLGELVTELADLCQNITDALDLVQKARCAAHDAADAIVGASPPEAKVPAGYCTPAPTCKGEGILGDARAVMFNIGEYAARIKCSAIEIIADIERL